MIVLLQQTPALQKVHLATDYFQYPQIQDAPQRFRGYNHEMHNEPQSDDIVAELAHRTLWVRCGDMAFARLSRAILSEARMTGTDENSVHDIVLVKASTHPVRNPSSRLRDRLCLAGCGIVALAVIIVLAIGVMTIYHQWPRWPL
jgi:hypothetical protein